MSKLMFEVGVNLIDTGLILCFGSVMLEGLRCAAKAISPSKKCKRKEDIVLVFPLDETPPVIAAKEKKGEVPKCCGNKQEQIQSTRE
jgi:hypothetical protein